MKLFLSSENLGKYPDIFIKMVGLSKSVLYIGNAGDYKAGIDHKAKIAEHKQQFEGLGLKFTELDLRQYFDKKIPPTILDDYGMVWCSGGNTFLLRAAFLQSGLDKILTDKVGQNAIAYGGSSAGALLAGPTLKGAQHGDDPHAVLDTYGFDIEWTGLELVNVVCVPHCESDWFGESAQKMIVELNKSDTPYVALKDGQVYLVDGDNGQLLV